MFLSLCHCVLSCRKIIVAPKKPSMRYGRSQWLRKVNLFAKNQLCDGRKERKLAIFGGAAVVGGQIGRKPWWSSAVYPVRQIWRKHRKASIYLSGQQLILYQTNRKKRENYTKLQTMLNSYLGSGFLEQKDNRRKRWISFWQEDICNVEEKKGEENIFLLRK